MNSNFDTLYRIVQSQVNQKINFDIDTNIKYRNILKRISETINKGKVNKTPEHINSIIINKSVPILVKEIQKDTKGYSIFMPNNNRPLLTPPRPMSSNTVNIIHNNNENIDIKGLPKSLQRLMEVPLPKRDQEAFNNMCNIRSKETEDKVDINKKFEEFKNDRYTNIKEDTHVDIKEDTTADIVDIDTDFFNSLDKINTSLPSEFSKQLDSSLPPEVSKQLDESLPSEFSKQSPKNDNNDFLDKGDTEFIDRIRKTTTIIDETNENKISNNYEQLFEKREQEEFKYNPSPQIKPQPQPQPQSQPQPQLPPQLITKKVINETLIIDTKYIPEGDINCVCELLENITINDSCKLYLNFITINGVQQNQETKNLNEIYCFGLEIDEFPMKNNTNNKEYKNKFIFPNETYGTIDEDFISNSPYVIRFKNNYLCSIEYLDIKNITLKLFGIDRDGINILYSNGNSRIILGFTITNYS